MARRGSSKAPSGCNEKALAVPISIVRFEVTTLELPNRLAGIGYKGPSTEYIHGNRAPNIDWVKGSRVQVSVDSKGA